MQSQSFYWLTRLYTREHLRFNADVVRSPAAYMAQYSASLPWMAVGRDKVRGASLRGGKMRGTVRGRLWLVGG